MENPSFSQVIKPADLGGEAKLAAVGFKRKKVRSKKTLRRKIYFSLIALLVLMSAILYGTYKVSQFFDQKKLIFQSPVQSPIKIEDRNKTEAPQVEPVKEAKAAEAQPVEVKPVSQSVSEVATPVSKIAARIWQLESGSTNSKKCEAKGMYNGYGYIPGSCYKSHEEVKALVERWVQARMSWPVAQMLCYYNTGERLSTCQYYKNYLAL